MNTLYKITLATFTLLSITSCSQKQNSAKVEPTIKTEMKIPDFQADSAYAFIKSQVEFGPRVPNSSAHKDCAKYLAKKLEDFGAKVTVQNAALNRFDGYKLDAKNIIGSFQPEKTDRILLCAHWDSRYMADQETDPISKLKPIDGANDGASGVGILLEIARHLTNNPTKQGIDIIFFDAEDQGESNGTNEHTWCLGAQYWSKNPHISNYYAQYGILLDMVGAPGAQFYYDYFSIMNAKYIVEKVWNIASEIGFGDTFIKQASNPIIDDHIYINQLANIPCIDIVHRDPSTQSNFGKYWHTHNDNMNAIDRKTLRAVGATVLNVIYKEE